MIVLLLLKVCLSSQTILHKILPSGFFSDTLPFSLQVCLFVLELFGKHIFGNSLGAGAFSRAKFQVHFCFEGYLLN